MRSSSSNKQEGMPMEPSGQCEMIQRYSDASSGGFVCEATSPEPQKPRLLDRVREEIRKRHYSLRTEKTSVGWIRRFILFHSKRHPAEMGAEQVSRYLSHLAVSGKVSASTQNQALVPCSSSTGRSSAGRSNGWKGLSGRSGPYTCRSS